MLTRRGFIKALAAIGGLLLLPASWLRGAVKKLAIDLSKVEKLRTVDGWAILKVKGRNILFVRDSEKTIRAVDPTCTHKKCTVEYSAKNKRLECPCHGSVFALDGSVLKKPAKKPLTTFPAEIVNDQIILSMDD